MRSNWSAAVARDVLVRSEIARRSGAPAGASRPARGGTAVAGCERCGGSLISAAEGPTCSACGAICDDYSSRVDRSSGGAPLDARPISRNGAPHSNNPYMRCQRFAEIMRSVLCQHCEVPAEVLNTVRAEFAVNPRFSELSLAEVRAAVLGVLKRNSARRFNKFYSKSGYIAVVLSGKPAPVMTHAEQAAVMAVFKVVDANYDRNKPPDRTNFFNYEYLLYKILEHFGRVDILPFVKLLNDPEALALQDSIWMTMCAIMKIPFVESFNASSTRH